MKKLCYSCVFGFGLLLPAGAAAQSDQLATQRQLPSESLAVLTPVATEVAPARAEPSSRLFVGTVLNEKGMPLAGALVSVGSERDQLVVTNAEGTYVLRSGVSAPVLRVTYAGYEEAALRVSNPQPVTFNLEPIDHYKRQLKKQGKAAEKAFYNK
ncbi:carboxypeptidase-like regulatory domain-containing protein [Hymenobacter algoricola]|uniref:Carboxypeptidase regulatory-like domain-containing protein n=1 Tax=Hymenobacter algoricola TaxID=486267 RepID=A0ABP7MXA3_9BACT